MSSLTLKDRLLILLKRSKKALMVYEGLLQNRSSTDLSQLQIKQWRDVNLTLLAELSSYLQMKDSLGTSLAQNLSDLYEGFYSEWQAIETELQEKQNELIAAAKREDFITAHTISRDLIAIKAKRQANRAVCYELKRVLKSVSQPEKPQQKALSLAITNSRAQSIKPASSELSFTIKKPSPQCEKKVVPFRWKNTKGEKDNPLT
ncbi:MAG: hypothetical protein D6780_00220 [Candidatus Dadabacteria bacterium]|nr:MAG: hypothetical protein D6780_00220 [Candidatus Dadabacteria bacterium]